jgi:HlyD family secretion protein
LPLFGIETMTRGRIGLLLLALVVLAGLVYGFLPKPVPVDLAVVERGPLTVSVEEEGKTRVRERYTVSAPAAGYARRIDLKVGDSVGAGQVLAVLEPSRSDALDPRSRAQAQARVGAAEAALAAAREQASAAEAAARLAEQELTRARALERDKFLSAQAVDQAASRNQQAQANLLASQHAVKVAAYDLQTARATLASTRPPSGAAAHESVVMVSPIKGRVLKVLHESEGSVAAGQPLVEVGNPGSLEVEVEVLSTSAVRIAPGAKVVLDRWGGEAPLQAAVRRIEPSGFTKVSALGVEEQRVRVIVDITSPSEQWPRLGDGYRVEARFVIWEGADVLQAPTSALFRQNSGWAVFVQEGEVARLRPVEIGQRTGLRAQVLAGLKVGERVIAHPDDKVADGVKVKSRGG